MAKPVVTPDEIDRLRMTVDNLNGLLGIKHEYIGGLESARDLLHWLYAEARFHAECRKGTLGFVCDQLGLPLSAVDDAAAVGEALFQRLQELKRRKAAPSASDLREQIAAAITGHTWLYDENADRLAGLVNAIDRVVAPLLAAKRDRAEFAEAQAMEMAALADRHKGEVSDLKGALDDIGRSATPTGLSQVRAYLVNVLPVSPDQAVVMSTKDMCVQLAAERDELDARVAELTRELESARALNETLSLRLAEQLEWRPVAQEAGEPTRGRASDFFDGVDDEPAGDLEETLRSAVAEAVDRYDPPVARVWRKGDPMPPHGTRVRTADGEQILVRTLGGELWHDEADPDSFGSWPVWLHMAGPLQEVP